MAKVATDFEKIIQQEDVLRRFAGRERKKNEALAQKIFSKDRRQSAPSKLKPGAGPSLASRVGITKNRTASLGPKALLGGNIDGDWTHDLHGTVNGGGRGRNNGNNGGAGGLASRISAPGGRPAPAAASNNNRRAERRAEQKAARVAAAIERSGAMADVQMASVANVVPTGPSNKQGLSIRGLAGPFAVMAQNFASGTTAADIESAMTPVGGEMLSCRIIKTAPLLVAEMVFATKEGGDAVISTFNNQTADGRIIKVYPKPGGYKEPASRPANTRSTSSNVVDGTNGFPEAMEQDDGGLYSDKLVSTGGNGGGNSNRRGRGFNRGGRR
ncbi:hypothetical protein CORC01_13951 [Colletotrichum orchidophilum]|uniref:RNA-binding protein n=1 Tax=Colletotrichum orchidophilum TaxID=1209926 RepID=A0A1G4ANL2_9PEZI|nr:uncharacterized protein CORC01_13951 [Colletotrichum orchidophilum]OHE90754.1 hypothetical protein CORC01_13951 [Colletotrichum orchidophilum]